MGILACMSLLTKITPEAIILIWVMSFLPDFDVLLEPLQKIRKMYFLSHKAASHSYIVGLIFTGVISAIISPLRNSPFLEIWLGGFLGYCIHVSLDFYAASRVPIFYPLSKREFRFFADRAINPLLAIFSSFNILYLIGVFFTGANYYDFMTLNLIYIIIYSFYFGIHAFLKIFIQIRSPKGYQYIPGFLLVTYLMLENHKSENGITFKLMKRSILSSKKEELINESILNDSLEMTLYKKTKEISHEYRFFHKWNAIIPFFLDSEDSIKVVLILAESYSRMSSYSLSVVFNKKTQEVLSKNESFGHFKKWNKQEYNS
jgi:membrane-bound metal-dependent hydrolase YbcI (DUF457 family)